MKKNISFITMNSSLGLWLRDKLLEESQKVKGSQEFAQELLELLNGEVDTLMIGMDENSMGIIEKIDDAIYSDDLVINPKTRRVLREGEEIVLTPKEFDILYFLAKNKGVIFTKEQIYSAVWEDDYLLADSNIMAFIRKLRKKIEYNPDEPRFIVTIWGVGYKFNDMI